MTQVLCSFNKDCLCEWPNLNVFKGYRAEIMLYVDQNVFVLLFSGFFWVSLPTTLSVVTHVFWRGGSTDGECIFEKSQTTSWASIYKSTKATDSCLELLMFGISRGDNCVAFGLELAKLVWKKLIFCFVQFSKAFRMTEQLAGILVVYL